MFPSSVPSRDSIPPAFGGVPPSLSCRSTRTSDAITLLRAAVDQAPQGVMILSETGRSCTPTGRRQRSSAIVETSSSGLTSGVSFSAIQAVF